MDFGRGAAVEVVAVHGDIKAADRDRMFPNIGEQFAEAFRQGVAAGGYADEDNASRDFIALGDFVGDAREGTANRGGIQDDGGIRHGRTA
jgi:hypothetical protein